MPHDKGRASRACDSCRKLKTRCYESRAADSSCLRCERLEISCSLAKLRSTRRQAHAPPNAAIDGTDQRLSRLERAVERLLQRLDPDAEDDEVAPSPAAREPFRNESPDRVQPPGLSTNPSAAPVLVIRDIATEMGVESPGAVRSSHSLHDTPGANMIDEGFISHQDAVAMVRIFHQHYGRWVCFDPLMSSNAVLDKAKQSPLLLCACCLIAVRHTNQELAARLAPALFEKAKALLSIALLTSPQTIDFFQAAIVLSMWSTTVGQVPLSIDSWLLSGFAVQHCVSSDLFDPILNGQEPPRTKQDLELFCLWSHIALVHLHYSVGTRRKSMIARSQMDRCRAILESDYATNYEIRMVAEGNLYWILYEDCCLQEPDLPKIQTHLHVWRQEWRFVLDQPRSQFLEMGYNFAQLLAYDQSLKSRSARVRESLISEMVRLALVIINLAMDTTDERTRHLSDHIYHMIVFAAVTLCRILNMYEDQIKQSHSLEELDANITTLVSWLHTIGLPCHAAHTLGDVVAAFHKKLRPLAHPSPLTTEEINAWNDPIFSAFFPDLLGSNPSNTYDWNMLPNWEPFGNNIG